ncbi:hypothetical protein CV467_07005 [Campylobacter jejuni subsp. jejuni]|uniref:Uncharacterized protein n=1 Tax=Campylobacter jejuni TaxID=197 RepID=A0A5Y6RJB0_CAMJU|nr:hypothetical protein [Campylobacter jejuni]PJP75040.1 hypothetical protein CV376_04000 [Campylobacter jejuni subsp. jejuni]EAH5900278.1 hypothetical protein [Campylobacter jejuni]EAH6267763.1 hypothetical protein [Campylobacter jejuni]EAH8612354.1 hypothetical protein [Campylobacter jejuni]
MFSNYSYLNPSEIICVKNPKNTRNKFENLNSEFPLFKLGLKDNDESTTQNIILSSLNFLR